MKPAVKRILRISGLSLGVVLLVALAAALLLVFDKPLVRNILQKQLSKGAGSTARIGRLDYALFPFRVSVEALEVGREDAVQKLNVTLARFEANGSFWKLVRGVKPAFDEIKADGLTVRLDQKAVSKEPLDIPKVLLQVSDSLAWAKGISLDGARLSFGLLTGRTEVEDLLLTLTLTSERDVVAYTIGGCRVSMTDPDGTPILATMLRSSGRLGLASPYILDSTFTLKPSVLPVAGLEAGLESVTLALTGRLDRSNQELVVSGLKVAIPGLIDLQGAFTGKSGYGVFVEAEGTARLEDLSAAAKLLGPRLPAEIRAAGLRGRAQVTGKYVLQRSDQDSKDNLSASLTLDGVDLTPVLAGRPLPVKAAGRIEAAGPSRDPRISVDLRSSLGRFALSGLAAASADLRVVGSGSTKEVLISRLDARLSKPVFGVAAGQTIAFEQAALSGQGTVDLSRRTGVLDPLEIRLPGLAAIRLFGKIGARPKASSDLRLESRGLGIPALRALAAPFVPASLAGWDLGGTIDLDLSARRPSAANSDWSVSGTLAFADAKFNDAAFTIAGEGLDPLLKFEGTGTPAKGLTFKAGLAIGRGESLWKSVYVSWSRHPLHFEASGRALPGSGAIEDLVARVVLPEVGSIDVTGRVALGTAPAFDLATEARLNLGPLYSLYTQAGVAEESRMKLEGTLAASLGVRRADGGLSVAGRVKLADANVERPLTKTFLLGLAADLPLHYESSPIRQEGPSSAGTVPPAGIPAGPLPEEGRIHIDEFQNPLLTLKGVAIAVRTGPNALDIEPLSLELFGGRLELGRTSFRLDPASGSFRGVGSLVVRDLDIARFPIASPQFKLTGKIQADFPRLDIGPELIAVSGHGEAGVFGGKVILRDLAVADPFAPGRSISLNVDLVDLDLKKLTDEVPFGEVTGIVRGEIRDLVITYKQPESFFFQIESVPRKGVPQTFSLKAVDNLTVLSSGQQASGGTGNFWMSFIRGFRYQQLGIVSTLRNDTFTLNGTIREGGIEYLVKKPALFGISVVNREPGKSISFKEMTGRLKRVGQSGK